MKIKIGSILLQKYSTRKPLETPKEIELNKEASWMIGFWVGDNWSNREGSVFKNGKRSSGKFGINNNDVENIIRFKKGLMKEFGIKNIKIDIQIPKSDELNKKKSRSIASSTFRINQNDVNVYFGSPWRRNVGYAVYTNNTFLLRIVTNEIYRNLPDLLDKHLIHINSFLQGITDSEGMVNKVNKTVSITNKDVFVINIISLCLKRLGFDYKISVDERERTKIDIKMIKEFKEKIDFNTVRKRRELSEMLSGNYCRERDNKYLNIFYNELKRGTSAKRISEVYNIPLPTVKLVLRNLFSAKHLIRKKESKHYVYMLPSSLSN